MAPPDQPFFITEGRNEEVYRPGGQKTVRRATPKSEDPLYSPGLKRRKPPLDPTPPVPSFVAEMGIRSGRPLLKKGKGRNLPPRHTASTNPRPQKPSHRIITTTQPHGKFITTTPRATEIRTTEFPLPRNSSEPKYTRCIEDIPRWY
ncbi:hypothetical protein TNIN_396551 [Trichonephila inaurata madagascariensis]|uniref:Uncharacterized protein n=1 Tax=Trichonephila inaurata madagascariensis TaxID=2747483 RepID=A0A8X6WN99_9ARAC|nr:hypothetical protein TNIN_396551 [Trichonephila inaurata madagascariensis]